MTPKPDFFIVGAPKAGTTSLQYYLGQHPDVFMPEEKEIHFFGSDLGIREPRPSEGEYLEFFQGGDQAARVGEASVWYLYSEEAAEEIHAFEPDADIIISLRNPIEMAHALHSQLLFIGDETIEDFDDALDAEASRRKGNAVPEGCNFPASLLYRKVASYPEQLERYLDVFAPEQVHVVIFDDLVEDSPGTVRRLYEALNVDPAFEPDLERRNPNMRVRSWTARRLVEMVPSRLREGIKRSLPGPVRDRVVPFVRGLHTEVSERPPMSPKAKTVLREAYEEDVQRLSKMLDRNLSHWLEVGEVGEGGQDG